MVAVARKSVLSQPWASVAETSWEEEEEEEEENGIQGETRFTMQENRHKV